MIKFPKPLKKGDKVFLVCTSSPILQDEIQKCKKIIENFGYEVEIGKSLFENIGGYMAGSPETRIKDLHYAFSNPEIKGIFCIKGGFSSSQLLDKLDYELIKKNPKIFVGYSDVTNLNIVLNQKCNLGTFHGPMVKSNMLSNFSNFTKNSFSEVLNYENEKKFELKNPENQKIKLLNKNILKNCNKIYKTDGTLIGGNLSLLVTTLGTKYEIDTKDKILFIEEIEEEISRIDRMMTHLKLSGKLEKCRAILFGNFDGCKNSYDTNYTLNDFFKNFFKDYKKPVITGIECGHKKPDLVTLPLGAKCEIEIFDNFDTKIYFKK